MTALLEARNVSKVYSSGSFGRKSTNTALDQVSLIIDDTNPSVTVVAGESGSGKTTLAHLLLGVIDPSAGEIYYQGKAMSKMSPAEHQVFRREVQAVFQDPFEAYNPFHKVDRVLFMPLRKFGIGNSDTERRRMVSEALEMVGLHPDDTLGRYPHQLSGGQRQRIMVARALVLRPRIIIADEPVSMVDASLRATILESLLRLNQELGISLVYITHDLTTAYQVGDNIIILYRGDVAELGDVDLVIKQPQHPYTRLLVDSIPVADPGHRWGQVGDILATDDENDVATAGCKFVGRCVHAMPICSTKPVPAYRTDANRGVACYLYDESPVMTPAELPQMLAQIAMGKRASTPERVR
jgi:oligopeptide/dipeptide ABC transporter ATP-binding protein